MTEETTTKAPRVAKCNSLIDAAYKMSLGEKRLLLMLISGLDPQGDAYKDMSGLGVDVTVRATDYADLYGVSTANAYRDMVRAAEMLGDRKVRRREDHGDKTKWMRWISGGGYREGQGEVTVTFSGKILLYLTGLHSSFTGYNLLGVSGLASTHSIRVYELCQQYRDTGWREISVDDLRRATMTENMYPEFANLRRRVIDKACREVTEKSDLEISWTPKKIGKKITAIRFKIRPKKQKDLFA